MKKTANFNINFNDIINSDKKEINRDENQSYIN